MFVTNAIRFIFYVKSFNFSLFDRQKIGKTFFLGAIVLKGKKGVIVFGEYDSREDKW